MTTSRGRLARPRRPNPAACLGRPPRTPKAFPIADAVGNQTLFAYNDDSTVKTKKLLSVVDAAFTRTHDYHYDADGRLDRIETKNAADAVTRVETRGYDPETGRLASVSSPEGTIDYGYDFAGSLKSMAYVGREVDYVYDFNGRLSRATAPEGEWNYTYNAAGLKETVTTQPAGGGAALTELWKYDPLGRVKSITHRRAGESLPIFKIEYILGADGMRIGAIETRGADVVTWTYEYDALGRLTREKRDAAPADGSPHTDRNVTYAYDRDSNRVRMDDELDPTKTRLYEYETLAIQPAGLAEGAVQTSQRLHQIKDADGVLVETYAWTANGELKTKTAGQTVENYAWGPAGTLDRYTRTEANVERARVDYEYDGQGQRIGQRTRQYANGAVISEESRAHLIDRENLSNHSQSVALVDGQSGAVREIYSIADRVTSHSTMTNNSTTNDTHFLLIDALGSTRSEAVNDEPIDFAYDYTAFGESLSEHSPGSSLVYTGQYEDRVTEYQYHRARWLSCIIGRWLSQDRFCDFPVNFGHAYIYGGSSAFSSDPSGNMAVVMEAGIAAAIADTVNQMQLGQVQDALLQAQGLFAGLNSTSLITDAYAVLFWSDVILTAASFVGIAFAGARMLTGLYKILSSSAGRRALGLLAKAFKTSRKLTDDVIKTAKRVDLGGIRTISQPVARDFYNAVGGNDVVFNPRYVATGKGRFLPTRGGSYYASTPETALSEVEHHIRRNPIYPPGGVVDVQVHQVEIRSMEGIVDMTDPINADKFGGFGAFLDPNDVQRSMDIANELAQIPGVKGILFRSVRDPLGTNLILFNTDEVLYYGKSVPVQTELPQ